MTPRSLRRDGRSGEIKQKKLNRSMKMNDVQELIDTCEKLCHNLGEMAANEKRFCVDLCQAFDMMSFQVHCMGSDIRELTDRWGS